MQRVIKGFGSCVFNISSAPLLRRTAGLGGVLGDVVGLHGSLAGLLHRYANLQPPSDRPQPQDMSGRLLPENPIWQQS